jgi:hypothetical protein
MALLSVVSQPGVSAGRGALCKRLVLQRYPLLLLSQASNTKPSLLDCEIVPPNLSLLGCAAHHRRPDACAQAAAITKKGRLAVNVCGYKPETGKCSPEPALDDMSTFSRRQQKQAGRPP